jgi:hypothetical protein
LFVITRTRLTNQSKLTLIAIQFILSLIVPTMQNIGNDERKGLTPESVGFLKTATAAPDFQSTDLEGIPDSYAGATIVKKDYLYETIECAAGKATYIVVTPTAGVAYYTTSVNTATPIISGTLFTGKEFPDAGQLFQGAGQIAIPGNVVSNTSVVDKGRLIALSAELVCLNNAFNQYGSISCWKTPMACEASLDESSAFGIVENFLITGVPGVEKTSLNAQSYVEPVRNGAYSVSMNRESEYEFANVKDNVSKSSLFQGYLEQQVSAGVAGKTDWVGPAVLWDNGFDTIVYRVDVPSATVAQSFVLKIWKAFEYQPVYNSLLFTMSHLSPEPCPAALVLYKEIERQLPSAVPAKDNPDFWNTVLNLVGEASDILSIVPGPVGTVAKGVHAVSSLLTPVKTKPRKKGRKTTRTRTVKAKGKKAKKRLARS